MKILLFSSSTILVLLISSCLPGGTTCRPTTQWQCQENKPNMPGVWATTYDGAYPEGSPYDHGDETNPKHTYIKLVRSSVASTKVISPLTSCAEPGVQGNNHNPR